MVDDNVVSYGSRKQGLNAQSTREAELITMNEGLHDGECFRGRFKDLDWDVDGVSVKCDNQPLLH